MRANYPELVPRVLQGNDGARRYSHPGNRPQRARQTTRLTDYGCAFCTDMHAKEAKLNGERELRLYHVPVWRESNLFNEKERAALEWAEKLTTPGWRTCDRCRLSGGSPIL